MRGDLAILSPVWVITVSPPLIRLRAGPQTPSPLGEGILTTKVDTMYHPFFQFVLPRLGQAALDILLYLNFLQLPPLQLVAQWPVLYYGLPLVLMALLAYISRDPLGLGIVFVGHLVTFYCIGTGIGLALRRVGGAPLTVWHIFWLGGITPWLLTGFIMWWGRRRALRLCTTKYNLTTQKALPNGQLRIVQISDVHPRACAAMDRTRIPELREKVAACQPDLLVLTGDIFDEYTEKEDFDAFCQFFGEIDAPLGKYYVLGQPRPVSPLAGAEFWPRRPGVRLCRSGCPHSGGHRHHAVLRRAHRRPQGSPIHQRQSVHGGAADAHRPGRPLHGLA